MTLPCAVLKNLSGRNMRDALTTVGHEVQLGSGPLALEMAAWVFNRRNLTRNAAFQ